MKCPCCKSSKTKVLDTRQNSSPRAKTWMLKNVPYLRGKTDIDWRYRKRICISCEEISYSIEYIVSDFNDIIGGSANEEKKHIPRH